MANALSKRYAGIVNCITTPVKLTNPFTGVTLDTEGIWDTGATNSVITQSTANTLNLKPHTRATVAGVHGPKEVNVYYVEITLNNDQITLRTEVTECEELRANHSVGMLIGMNIISMGDFCITNFNGKTVMSFIHPSQKDVDFVRDIKEYNRIMKMHEIWIKRGIKKCPCGSGKTFENCHGKMIYK